MVKRLGSFIFSEAAKLDAKKREEINRTVAFEMSKAFHSMVKLGAITNILGALLYVISIYNPSKAMEVIYWYLLLVTANLINVFWAWRFEYTNITPPEIQKCRTGFLYIVMSICLIWGSIGIIFMSGSVQQQITTILFLSAVLICFSFSTAIDLTMSIISIICLLSPTILYYLYLYMMSFHFPVDGDNFPISIFSAFLILGCFMLVACYAANKIIVKIFRLGYENSLLSQKLEAINIQLENRVKERTDELETTLKLVTFQSTHDQLTELPNERFLHDATEKAIEEAVKYHQQFAIASFSINGMGKIINGLGHQASTAVILRIAKRFLQLFKNNKRFLVTLSRQDVFTVLIKPIHNESEIEHYSNKLFEVLTDPLYINSQSLQLTGSIGFSVFPNDGRDIDALITNAEAARVLASQNGGNRWRIYSTTINADASRQLIIESELYHAIEHNELRLYYQPFIDLQTGKVCGAEALVRWNNRSLGLVPPDDFIRIAESNGMILPIGEWVLRKACEQLQKWHKLGYKSLKISVNLSAKQLEQENIANRFKTILSDLKFNPKYLEFELTESEVFNKDAIPTINKLTEMGVSLAIDDFGTGYSEFSNLKLFKVNKIKIDKIFIQDIDVNIDSRNIVCNTIALAKSMNISCLAEGVENEMQIEYLRKNGCYIMQGFYFSKPMNADDFTQFLINY